MAGWQNKKSSWDPTIVSAKDHIMASENALTAAIATFNLQLEVAKLTGEVPPSFSSDDVLKLATKYYDEHMARGGSTQAAVNNVVHAFPGAQAEAPTSGGSRTGSAPVPYGKYKGQPLAQVYGQDPAYVRGYMTGDRVQEFASGAKFVPTVEAFLAEVDAAADEDDPYAE